MKKIFINQYISRLMLLTATLLVAACSAKEDPVVPPVYPTEGVSFSISAEQWGESPLTRAAGEGTAADTVVSLCDEVSASVCCIADLPDPATKASTSDAPQGYYTIVATQGGNETVINVYWNGTAILDKTTGKAARMDLAPGEYNFLCFNDKLERSGGQLVITSANDYANALSGTCQSTIVEGTQTVQFTLKHHFARLKVSIMGCGLNETAKDIVYEKQQDGSALSREISYANTAGYTARLNSVSENLLFTGFKSVNAPEAGIPSWLKAYQKIESQYIYLTNGQTLPSTMSFLAPDAATGQNMVYGISMQGTAFPLNGTSTTCHSNDSYTLRVFVSYNYKYLFSDGTVGTLAANWKSKTPVALVCRSKTDVTEGMAVALKDANSGASCSWTNVGNKNTTGQGTTQRNKTAYDYPAYSTNTIIDDINGYSYTWETTHIMDNDFDKDSNDNLIIRAINSNYPAFKAAAEYDPGVTLSGSISASKWYLPSYSDMASMYYYAGHGFSYTGDDGNMYSYRVVNTSNRPNPGFYIRLIGDINATFAWRGNLFNIGIRQAGGVSCSSNYHTATETKYTTTYLSAEAIFSPQTFGRTAKWHNAYSGTSPQEYCKVRPFINF